MSSTQNDALVALYRYFIVASRTREEFKRIQDGQDYKQKQSLSTNDFVIYLLSGPPSLYFIWCGMLYVVVEGYQELNLKDSAVDSLLADTRRHDVLRRCRNGIFHFQKDYFDDRFMEPLKDLFFTQWAIDLAKALGVSIKNELQAKEPIPAPQVDLSQFL
jgi:hypothetical protein